MGGAHYGAPERAGYLRRSPGGPLAPVRDGGRIGLGVSEGRLDPLVPEAELQARRAALPQAVETERRGCDKRHDSHVLQAEEGVDVDLC
ncbi:dihydroxy-acid dehydratase domain-containing protein [Bosea minatitlanensis]|uniref:dihydroxy-acid dehydratase domain-containing protein n=1 Tax=Bosea minatitlanensis TaxID=128782 RepID=UPI0021A4D628|nr:dihydroxy-acid dehydratase [Bosea minatitlanensis]MCT4496109.1 dihydroxy-acid dehydratase [Bosea minatitlanensis]